MSDVQLSRDLGFLRVGAAAPVLRVADVDFNVAAIVDVLNRAAGDGAQVVTLPEMALTGYTIGDLVHHAALLTKAERGLGRILKESAGNGRLGGVGMPVSADQRVFNCAVVLNSGRILGVIPKTLLPSHKEFYEGRWFSSGRDAVSDSIELAGTEVPL